MYKLPGNLTIETRGRVVLRVREREIETFACGKCITCTINIEILLYISEIVPPLHGASICAGKVAIVSLWSRMNRDYIYLRLVVSNIYMHCRSAKLLIRGGCKCA
jgi:hypothetical protein